MTDFTRDTVRAFFARHGITDADRPQNGSIQVFLDARRIEAQTDGGPARPTDVVGGFVVEVIPPESRMFASPEGMLTGRVVLPLDPVDDQPEGWSRPVRVDARDLKVGDRFIGPILTVEPDDPSTFRDGDIITAVLDPVALAGNPNRTSTRVCLAGEADAWEFHVASYHFEDDAGAVEWWSAPVWARLAL